MASASATVLPPIALGSSCPFPAKDSVCLSPASWPSQLMGSRSRSYTFSPLPLRSAESERSARIVAMATGETRDPNQAARDAWKYVQETWEGVDDKLAVGGLGFTALIGLWAVAGLIGAIDKLPIIPNFFEFVGIFFTSWFIYRYLLFKPDREELLKKVEDAVGKITGSERSI